MDRPGMPVEEGGKSVGSYQGSLDMLRIRSLSGVNAAHQFSIARRRLRFHHPAALRQGTADQIAPKSGWAPERPCSDLGG